MQLNASRRAGHMKISKTTTQCLASCHWHMLTHTHTQTQSFSCWPLSLCSASSARSSRARPRHCLRLFSGFAQIWLPACDIIHNSFTATSLFDCPHSWASLIESRLDRLGCIVTRLAIGSEVIGQTMPANVFLICTAPPEVPKLNTAREEHNSIPRSGLPDSDRRLHQLISL